MKRLLRIVLIVSFCWAYAGLVWASEDSGENPFPEGFNFDELPEIDDLPPIEPLKEPTETLQTNKNIEASLAKKESDNVFIPSVESKKSLPAAVMVPKKNDIERERIIIPKKKNSVSENSSEKSLTKALKESSEEIISLSCTPLQKSSACPSLTMRWFTARVLSSTRCSALMRTSSSRRVPLLCL